MFAKGFAFHVAACLFAAAHLAPGESASPRDSSEFSASSVALAPQPEATVRAVDPCVDPRLQPNWMPPTWNVQAAPEQCGALETDNVAVFQPLGDGVSQWALMTTAKYGLTPRLQLRWGLPGRIVQRSSGARPVTGTTDQPVGLLYHFRDQKGWIPDLSVDYGFKVPSANPSKGFGSGYADHVITLIASRDFGRYHVDYNFVHMFSGGGRGFDPAVQSGAGVSRTFAHNLMGTLEGFGGSQPGTADRYGALLLGGSWGIRPWLALNGGCIHSYTAGSPRDQLMLGFIYTMHPGLTLPRGPRLSRLLGR